MNAIGWKPALALLSACVILVVLLLRISSSRPQLSVGTTATDISRISVGYRGSLPHPGPLHKIKGCNTCHSMDGSACVGGTLKDFWGSQRTLSDGRVVVADMQYFRRALLEPGAEIVAGFANQMPTQKGRISEAQIEDMAKYFRSISQFTPAPTPDADD